jgi:hypothetical protein
LILEGTGADDVDLARFDDSPVLVRPVPEEGSDG